MTIGAIILLIIFGIIGIIISIAFLVDDPKLGIIALLVCLLVWLGAFFGLKWYYGSTASGACALKDQQSNFNLGLNREITITAEGGR